ETLAFGVARNFCRCPGIDGEIDEHHTFGVEEKKNFVQPVDDLRRFIRTRRLEITFFERPESRRIDQNADEPLRSRDERFFPIRSPCENTDIGSMLEQFKLESHTYSLYIELNIPIE